MAARAGKTTRAAAPPRADAAQRVVDLLRELRAARDPEVDPRNGSPRLLALRGWQARRLAECFADLRNDDRHAAAAEFFLTDLYGEHDVSWRARDLERMLPTLRRWLPVAMLETVADALALDLLSQHLDLALAEAHERIAGPRAAIDERNYAEAYRAAGTRAERERQIDLIRKVGEDLDAIVRKPLVFTILRLARGPAARAGLGQLQSFLERGFGAFRVMGGAEAFLDTIEGREREVMRRLYANHPKPFDVCDT
jgi:hypothetical protein